MVGGLCVCLCSLFTVSFTKLKQEKPCYREITLQNTWLTWCRTRDSITALIAFQTCVFFFVFFYSQSKKPVLKAGGVKTLKTTLHILSSMQKCFFYLTSWAMRYCEIVIWTDGHTHPPSWSCLGRRFPLPMAIVMIRYSKNGRTKKWNRMENESMNTSQTTLRD